MYKKSVCSLVLSLLVLFIYSCSDNDDRDEKGDLETNIVGYWSGEIGYTCSSGEHQAKKGVVVFEEDGTGILLEKDKEPSLFDYKLEPENKKIIVLFKKGKRTQFEYKDLTKTQLVLSERCASCGNEVVFKVARKEPMRSIHVTSTLGYEEIFTLHYDDQDRISAIDYKHIDTDGEGDNSEGTVYVSYATNKIRVTNALLSDYSLYSVDFTLNKKGWATHATYSYQNNDNDYSGRGTLNFFYDSNDHQKSITYTYQNSSFVEQISGTVRANWSDNLLLKMMTDNDVNHTVINYGDTHVPPLTINLPYFMIYRYNDETISCGNDNVVMCYASILNILGKAPQNLMSNMGNENDNERSEFQFTYEWCDHLLSKIYEHSTSDGDNSSDECDTQISISYF